MKDGSRRIVAAVDEAAFAMGLRSGHAVAQAQASIPDLVIVDARPGADEAALGRLAAWCLRYSPLAQPDPPDGIFIDVTGATHLWGGEADLLADLRRRLARSGLAARAALAETMGAAWALARYAHDAIVPPDGTAAALADLPVAALRLPDETCAGLRLLGIERIGDLGRFPRAQLTLRFGHDVMARHDRAHGHAPEPLTPVVPTMLPQARSAFAEPLGDVDGLAAAIVPLVAELCGDLDRRRVGLRRLDLVARRVDGHPIGLRVGTSMPSRDPAHLVRLLAGRLPEIDPGFGIDEIVLAASRTERMRDHQADLRQTLDPSGLKAADPHALAPLVDRLGSRLGARHVYRVAPVESRYPERSVRRIPALAPARGASWPAHLPRPSRIFDPPEPVTAFAIVPDEPPGFFVWRRVRYVVRLADGPERVRGEWWRTDEEAASLRDYYRVEADCGRRFWLFRDAPMSEGGRWWLHGRFV